LFSATIGQIIFKNIPFFTTQKIWKLKVATKENNCG